MPYLVIKSSDYPQITSYQMTSDCNKPRLAVGGSYIPISTASGGVVPELKLSGDGKSYRVLQHTTTSSSQSASATYLTTANSPDGLSNVTNLTRISTSNTIYQTRASTSATLTRVSTSATLTRASTSATLTRASTSATLTRASTSNTVYGTAQYAAQMYIAITGTGGPWGSSSTGTVANVNPVAGTWYYWGGREVVVGANGTMGLTSSPTDGGLMLPSPYPWLIDDYREASPVYYKGSIYTAVLGTWRTWSHFSKAAVVTTNTIYLTRESIYGYATRASVSGYGTRQSVSGYATRESISGYGTRASTSGTVYETRESVSGYSGISSSSSSESASATTWA